VEPAGTEEAREIIKRALESCDADQIAAFRRFSIQPHFAPLVRYGRQENVMVVARNADEVLYREDVEDGFNISPIGADGIVLQH